MTHPSTSLSPWRHTVAGMHLGSMTPRPLAGEFDAVLTLAKDPGIVDGPIRRNHIPLSYVCMDENRLTAAIDWAFGQVQAEHTLLVRSEKGRQRPGLVVAGVCLRLGASFNEALCCVNRTGDHVLTDFRYLDLLQQMEAQL